MSSGSEILALIDRMLQGARVATDALAQQLQRTSSDLGAIRQSRLAALGRLARLRLRDIERGEILQSLGDTDKRVAAILAERAAASTALDAQITAAREALADRERERADGQAAADGAAGALDAAEAEAQRRLAADQQHRTKLEAANGSDRVADRAEEKAAAARTDRAVKGKPYEADAVFTYLWRRGYGTSRYRAWPLTRLLDRWVARRGNFEELRRNYAMLTDIPPRLDEHAARMRAVADGDLDALHELEERVAAAVGVPDKRARVEAAEQALEKIDEAIAKQEADIAALGERRARFGAAEDEFSARCTELLSQAFDREDIRALRERAASTPSSEDDRLIEELAELERKQEQLERNVEQYRPLHDTQRERMMRFEELRRQFKASRYDDPFSTFGDNALIAALLAQFLAGSVRFNDLWAAIQREHRYRRFDADPRFGSGGFPRPSPWRMPGGGHWGGRGGGFGGGGFRTGGGFKGGGFRTGGGF
jgi:hypothetical protein